MADWLISPGAPLQSADLFGALCDRLMDLGVPLFRASCGIQTMHPQIFSLNYLWQRGEKAKLIERAHGVTSTDLYLKSPVYLIHRGVDSIRRRLDIENPQMDFSVLKDLKDAGATDYVAMPLKFIGGKVNYISWSTDRPGGFTTEDLTLLYDLLPLISMRLELDTAYYLQETLLRTYLGNDAAKRVLAGTFKRTVGEPIRAAIMVCDLRGFTRMTQTLPADEVIRTLDDYFDCMAAPLKAHGGEVLKFMGDGMIAMFPVSKDKPGMACCRAMDAALEGLENLKKLNKARAAAGKEPLRIGVGLHIGDLVFGNIGAADRLDFTLIGPAVNEVSRMEHLCARLGRTVLVSSDFACQCLRHEFVSIGRHELPDLERPRELFVPQPEELP